MAQKQKVGSTCRTYFEWVARAMIIDISQLKNLTAAEVVVAYWVAQAKTNKEIAAELYVDSRTVESHVRNILGSTGYRNRTEIALAIDRLLQSWETPINTERS
jgi:DNA-binding NarL/FixJ family response regulator